MTRRARTRRRGIGSVTSYTTKGGARWRYQLRVPADPSNPTAGLVQRGRSGFRTASEADDALSEARRQAAAGANLAAETPTFKAYAEGWLEGLDLEASTLSGYRRNMRKHTFPHIGATPVDKVTAHQLARMYRALAADAPTGSGLAPNTIRKVHATLGTMLDAALEEGLVVVNPARKRAARPPSAKAVKSAKAESVVWTAVQLRAFLGWVRRFEGVDATIWEVYAATGCRRSELLALRWSDVDLKAQRVKVRQAVNTVTGEMKGTKSGRARVVDVDAATVAALKAWRSHRSSLALDFVRGDALVFGDLSGKVRNVNSVSMMFTYRVGKARKNLGADSLPPLTLHGLRHTHATLLLEAGENPKVVQERLGHASITITMDIYAHVTATMQRSAADRFEALLGG